ncbi:MAG TPA: hypothetical protein VGX25_18470 [Actinophytocola sp.]|uniref:sugar phosphate isomerase/epimerase family protein n=1 Tax=Actinophytocola sp. TaxID=1872138 RepID=UPI002DDCBC4D|nr:hypothetical protein [Actinophytocola sp.]HEV2781371.1 hypothetical protein [Actinophytocola sp.]
MRPRPAPRPHRRPGVPLPNRNPDLTEATRILRAAGRPNAGILIDLLHFAPSGSSLAELRRLPPEWFHFAQVCDAPAGVPATTEGLIHTARAERLLPGEGGIDVRGVLAALPAGIPYALEIPHAARTAEAGARGYVHLAITAARRHLDALEAVPTQAATA